MPLPRMRRVGVTTFAHGVVHSLASLEIARVACTLDHDESVSEIAFSNWWATVSGERASNCPQAVVVAISSTFRAVVIGASPDPVTTLPGLSTTGAVSPGGPGDRDPRGAGRVGRQRGGPPNRLMFAVFGFETADTFVAPGRLHDRVIAEVVVVVVIYKIARMKLCHDGAGFPVREWGKADQSATGAPPVPDRPPRLARCCRATARSGGPSLTPVTAPGHDRRWS